MIYENVAWVPTVAQLSKSGADASTSAGMDALVLTDLHMPDVDGLMFIEQLKSAAAPPHNIIILSSGHRPEHTQRAQRLGIRLVRARLPHGRGINPLPK